MWSLLRDNLTEIAAVILAITGAILKWRPHPRRMIEWIVAAKEIEMYHAMLENERQWTEYWKQQAEQCFHRMKDL